MSMRMEDVLSELPLSRDVSQALLTGDGLLGELLTWVMTYERGRFDSLGGGSPAADVILRDAYLEAVRWADDACAATSAKGELAAGRGRRRRARCAAAGAGRQCRARTPARANAKHLARATGSAHGRADALCRARAGREPGTAPGTEASASHPAPA